MSHPPGNSRNSLTRLIEDSVTNKVLELSGIEFGAKAESGRLDDVLAKNAKRMKLRLAIR